MEIGNLDNSVAHRDKYFVSATPASPTVNEDRAEQEINDNFLETFDRNLITDLLSDHNLQSRTEDDFSN